MNEGILQSSPVQQMVAGGGNNWFTTSGSLQQHHSLLAAPPPPPQNHHLAPPLTASSLSWTAASQELPQSWSQLVLGFAGEEDKVGISNWEQQLIMHNNINCSGDGDGYNAGNLEFTAARSSTNCSSLSPPMMSASPPKSCVTTTSQSKMKGGNSNVNSSKKSKMNPTTSAQCGIKVRKEKLGDRITALHQIVSPFGKTDTASVLLEAIGYIRFLQRQIEALSLPYLASGSPSINHQQSEVKRERTNCRFPEDPGQLLNENQRKRKAISEEECEEEEGKKDLKSRGLCLVPLSCTLDFGSEINGADYWAPSPSPSFAANFQ